MQCRLARNPSQWTRTAAAKTLTLLMHAVPLCARAVLRKDLSGFGDRRVFGHNAGGWANNSIGPPERSPDSRHLCNIMTILQCFKVLGEHYTHGTANLLTIWVTRARNFFVFRFIQFIILNVHVWYHLNNIDVWWLDNNYCVRNNIMQILCK